MNSVVLAVPDWKRCSSWFSLCLDFFWHTVWKIHMDLYEFMASSMPMTPANDNKTFTHSFSFSYWAELTRAAVHGFGLKQSWKETCRSKNMKPNKWQDNFGAHSSLDHSRVGNNLRGSAPRRGALAETDRQRVGGGGGVGMLVTSLRHTPPPQPPSAWVRTHFPVNYSPDVCLIPSW